MDASMLGWSETARREAAMKEIAYRVRATGRVQGVAYRAWAQG